MFTIPKPIPGTDPHKMQCLVPQIELYRMQSVIDSCAAALSQIAGHQDQQLAHATLVDGTVVTIPVQSAMAMAAMSHIFGVEYRAVPVGEDADGINRPEEVSVPSEDAEELVPEVQPYRGWSPTVITGGREPT